MGDNTRRVLPASLNYARPPRRARTSRLAVISLLAAILCSPCVITIILHALLGPPLPGNSSIMTLMILALLASILGLAAIGHVEQSRRANYNITSMCFAMAAAILGILTFFLYLLIYVIK